MDPSQGIIKWSARRAHQHLQAVVIAAVVIPLAATVAGLFLALPPHPTVAERIGQAAEALGVGLLLVVILAFLYAILLAPYEQRKELRSELLAVRAKYDELVDKVHKGLWSGGELDRYRSEPPVAFRLPRIDLDAVAHEHGTLARVIERPEVGAYGLASLD